MSDIIDRIEQHMYLAGQALSADFDAEEVFAREVYRDNPLFQDMKRWITEDLKQPLDTVTDIMLQGHMVELPEKVTEGPFKKFENTPFLSFIVLFRDGTYHIRNVNMDDYQKAGEA